MNMKKTVSMILAGLLSVVMLTGCEESTGNNTDSTNSVTENAGSTISSIDDLAGATIGVQLGTTGDQYATELEESPEEGKPASKIERYNTGADAINALKQGKVDCVIIDNEPAKVFVEKNDDLMILSEPFADEDYAVAIKKGNTELVDQINAALDELEAEGTLKKIVDNYIGDDTKGSFQYESPADADRSNGRLVMATNAAFPPYETIEGGQIVGIDPDIMQAVCDKLGKELVIEDMSFESIISAVQSGKADVGVAGMTASEDRMKNVDFSRPYAKGKQVIIVKK